MRWTSSLRQKIFYSVGSIGNGAYGGFNNAILPLYVQIFTSNPFIISYLGNTSTVEGVVLQPLVGRWSDRTTSRLGRRRPFILFGIPVSVFFLYLTPIFGHLRHAIALPLIIATIILFSITWNIAGDPTQSLLIDITSPQERPIFNSILTIIGLVSQIGIVLYTGLAAIKKNNIPDYIFYIAGGFLLVAYAVVFFGVREPKAARSEAEREAHIPLRSYLSEMQDLREALKLLLSIFFLWTGLNAFKPFITTLPIKLVHASKPQALIIYVVLVLSTAVFAYPFGRLAARYGNRRFIVLGTSLLIAAALWGLVIPSYIWFFPLAILAGCGFSATTVLTYPYLAQLVPDRRIGVFTGLQTAFSSIAVPISVLLVGTLIDRFGYRSVFALLALMMVIDVAILLTIDEPAARSQIAEAERGAALRVAPADVAG